MADSPSVDMERLRRIAAARLQASADLPPGEIYHHGRNGRVCPCASCSLAATQYMEPLLSRPAPAGEGSNGR